MYTLDEKIKNLQIILLQEIGLEVDSSNSRIRDQDTGNYITMRRRYLTVNPNNMDDVLLDPFNEKVINNLFAYYCSKMEYDDYNQFVVNHFGDYYERDENQNRVIYLGVSTSYPDMKQVTIETNRYNLINKSLRFIEAICRLNNNSNINLYNYCMTELEKDQRNA